MVLVPPPDENGFTIQFITSYDRNKQPFFAYLLIPNTLLGQFRKLITKLSINLPEFGVVIAKGRGHTVPDSVKQQIRAQFPHATL